MERWLWLLGVVELLDEGPMEGLEEQFEDSGSCLSSFGKHETERGDEREGG
jgi:hypothetical protein